WRNFSLKMFFQSAFPIVFEQYWFVTGYVILLLIQPFFKDYLNNTDKRDKLKFLLILSSFFYGPAILGFVFQINSYFTPNVYLIFIIVALLGDLIREYQHELKTKYFKYITIGLIFSQILLQFRPFIIDVLDSHHLKYPSYFINGTESLIALIFSICFFIFILKLKISSKLIKPIMFLSASTFDVYLLHD
ncbi:acyltransferase family protein, partial [Citrobacter braakii]